VRERSEVEGGPRSRMVSSSAEGEGRGRAGSRRQKSPRAQGQKRPVCKGEELDARRASRAGWGERRSRRRGVEGDRDQHRRWLVRVHEVIPLLKNHQ
jgi:hypothetical protein